MKLLYSTNSAALNVSSRVVRVQPCERHNSGSKSIATTAQPKYSGFPDMTVTALDVVSRK
ncbi:MAG: hypothetical protein WA633_22000 [Stellaceae bacterium]